MTKIQQVYRELRRYVSRPDARYAAPRLVVIHDARKAAARV